MCLGRTTLCADDTLDVISSFTVYTRSGWSRRVPAGSAFAPHELPGHPGGNEPVRRGGEKGLHLDPVGTLALSWEHQALLGKSLLERVLVDTFATSQQVDGILGRPAHVENRRLSCAVPVARQDLDGLRFRNFGTRLPTSPVGARNVGGASEAGMKKQSERNPP